MGENGQFALRCELGMGKVAAAESERFRRDIDFVNESVADMLKTATLATLLSVPGLVDAGEIAKKVGGAKGGAEVVQVSSPEVQKRIYDAIGKDKYEDAVIVNVLARTLMAETVGERSDVAFDAVASVIWNRSGGDKKRMLDVVFRPKQFSCWNSMTDADKRNFAVKPHSRALTNPSAWKYCVATAKKMVDGTFVPSGDWTHYYAHDKVTPSWSSKLITKKKIGNHTFGKI